MLLCVPFVEALSVPLVLPSVLLPSVAVPSVLLPSEVPSAAASFVCAGAAAFKLESPAIPKEAMAFWIPSKAASSTTDPQIL